jgi:hypothetical protein
MSTLWIIVKSKCGLHDASYRQVVEVTARQSVLSAFMAPILVRPMRLS